MHRLICTALWKFDVMKNLKNAKNIVLMILHMNNAITNQHQKHLNMQVKSAHKFQC